MKVCLLGASFTTGNLGVSALAESSIKVILTRWPDAEIFLVGSGFEPLEHRISISGRDVRIRTIPVRFSKNIFRSYHFLWFFLLGIVTRLLPRCKFRDKVAGINPYFRRLYDSSVAADITGGDSMSDLYGFRRFALGFLCKWLIIFIGKKFVLLPQTYGPFKSRLALIMAGYIFKRADVIYSRDREGVNYVSSLLGCNKDKGKVRLVPDVAFVLDKRRPAHMDVGALPEVRNNQSIVVGFNISGLLFNGGYTFNNMFELKTDYSRLVCDVIRFVMKDKRILVLLVPHVYPPAGCEVESDVDACSRVYKEIGREYPDRLFVANGRYDHTEIKYIIGLCDLFVGSRMHSCIAAMSQCVPSVGIAYSEKFKGVFETAGLDGLVIDSRRADLEEICRVISDVIERRDQIRDSLESVIPKVKDDVMGIFEKAGV